MTTTEDQAAWADSMIGEVMTVAVDGEVVAWYPHPERNGVVVLEIQGVTGGGVIDFIVPESDRDRTQREERQRAEAEAQRAEAEAEAAAAAEAELRNLDAAIRAAVRTEMARVLPTTPTATPQQPPGRVG